jgi:hypothetical protein
MGILSFVATVALGIPSAASADHCGAPATISRPWGPPGTTFVFRTNLGAPSDLFLYQDGRLVRSISLPGDGAIRYAIRTTAADGGRWRARAVVRGSPGCAAETSFTVGDAPDTDASAEPGWVEKGSSPWPSPWILASAALTAFWMAFRRTGGGQDGGLCRVAASGLWHVAASVLGSVLAGLHIELLTGGHQDAEPGPRRHAKPAWIPSPTAEEAPFLLLLRISIGSRRGRDRTSEDG